MLSKYEFEKLLHDIKRASKVLKLISGETSKDKRELLLSLVSDEIDRLYKDLEELKEKKGKK